MTKCDLCYNLEDFSPKTSGHPVPRMHCQRPSAPAMLENRVFFYEVTFFAGKRDSKESPSSKGKKSLLGP
jgi:hypothetical protein